MFAIRWKIPAHVTHGVTQSPIQIDPTIQIPSLESLLGIVEEDEDPIGSDSALHSAKAILHSATGHEEKG